MARTRLDDITDWVENAAQAATGRPRRRPWQRRTRDMGNAAKAFVDAARGLDRKSLKGLTDRLSHDDELRNALNGLTSAMKDLSAEAPRTSRRALRVVGKDGRWKRVGAVVAALGIGALAVKALLGRRGSQDPASVFDAHISSYGNGSHHAEHADSEVADTN